MPHSPRVHHGRLWLHNSGTGSSAASIPAAGRFEPLAFCPGYLRGLAFVGDHAVVGLSRPRHDQTFGGLALEDELAKTQRRGPLRLADDRPAKRRRRPLAAARGIGARALRRGRAARVSGRWRWDSRPTKFSASLRSATRECSEDVRTIFPPCHQKMAVGGQHFGSFTAVSRLAHST